MTYREPRSLHELLGFLRHPNMQGVPKNIGINDLVCFVYDLVDSDYVIWS